MKAVGLHWGYLAAVGLILLAGCSASLGGQPAETPEPASTRSPEIEGYMKQAAEQAPFKLLVLDETELPGNSRLFQFEIHPAEDDGPFIVAQVYRVPGGEIRVSQSSLKTGQAPMKAVDEVAVRGRTGYWLVLNTGQRALYWEEDDSTLTITGELNDDNTLRWAEALAVYKTGPAAPGSRDLGNPDADRLVEHLTQAGFDPVLEPIDPPTELLAPAPGRAYRLGEGRLYLHEFPDEAAARQKADEILADPLWAAIDWVGEPHFYRCDAAIALYLGSEAAVRAALEEQCGEPFAPVDR